MADAARSRPSARRSTGASTTSLATVENWSRAIQFSDGLGHIFRGEASFSPQFYERIVANLTGTPFDARGHGGEDDTRDAGLRRRPRQDERAGADSRPRRRPRTAIVRPQELEDLLDDLTDDLTQPLQPGADGQNEVEDLLDFLLGGPAP